jgi:putative mRNA 3-end processing factor
VKTPALVEPTNRGLYCPAGDFYIDPWRRVDRAIITHAHTDHARPGSRRYLCSEDGCHVLRIRLGDSAQIATIPYGQSLELGGVRISLHPAGHILGSVQVRLAHRGRVTVVSGDYKTQPDPTCRPIEPLPCHEFISESTFGLPVYRWPPVDRVLAEIENWWRENQAAQRTSVMFAYAMGKAQRILASLNASIGPIFVHATIAELLPAYQAARVHFPPAQPLDPEAVRAARGRALVLAPPAGRKSRWLHECGPSATAMASGWMVLRSARRRREELLWEQRGERRAAQRGFVLSDHADWDGLLETIRSTRAGRVGVTHGYVDAIVRQLKKEGRDAYAVPTRFGN